MSLPFQDTLNTVYKKRPELASERLIRYPKKFAIKN
jgi:hypothetical protein